MSFIIQIIDAALPGDATQRQRLINQLVEEHHANDSEPGEALTKLYRQLVVQYPCLSTYKEDVVDECVWGDGPLISDFGQRIAVLNVVQNEAQVLAVILKLAEDLNLKVVDVQTDVVYYPKSKEAIDFIAANEKSVVKEKPLTEKSVLDYLVTHLRPFFESAGFVWNKKEKWFHRSVPSYGEQSCRILIEKQRDRFAIFFGARLHIHKVQDVARKLKNDPTALCSIRYGYDYFTGEYLEPKVHNHNELSEFTEKLIRMVNANVLSFFDATLVLDEANKLTNNVEKCQCFLGTYNAEILILAYLVQPSKLQEVADIYRSYIKFRNYSEEAYQKPIDDIVNKLIELNPTL